VSLPKQYLSFRRKFSEERKVFADGIRWVKFRQCVGGSHFIALATELQFEFRRSDCITALNGSHSQTQRTLILEIVTPHER
jgi:hypothetical protein